MFSWVRSDEAGDLVSCVVNFSASPHATYSIGLPQAGVWTEILNTDSMVYDGTNTYGNMGQVTAYDVPLRGFDASATVAVPALGAIWLHWDPMQQVETSAGGES